MWNFNAPLLCNNSSSKAAYLFLPMVRLVTIPPKAAAILPTRAEAPPPPGTGLEENKVFKNSVIPGCNTISFAPLF